MGTLTCATKFSDCSTQTGAACGGRCPGNCDASTGSVFGFQTYTTPSSVCLSAKHSGVVRGPGDMVIWTIESGAGVSFPSKISSGIQSQYSGPLAEAAKIFYKQISIGQAT